MADDVPDPPALVVPLGTKVVTSREVKADSERAHRPVGSVAEIIGLPADALHRYLVRFADGGQARLRRKEFRLLGRYRTDAAGLGHPLSEQDLRPYIIYKCVIGSRAYGLAGPDSDTDRRGCYLPPADLHWSLRGVPEQLEDEATQECYWELEKFLDLALQANPNVLECLYTPLVEHATPLARELLDMRRSFLSKLAYQTFNGYVLSQFRKLEQDVRARGAVRWKHVMHMIRLLLSGVSLLREGTLTVDAAAHRDRLLEIRSGAVAWEAVETWRHELHRALDEAYRHTSLPDRPDYRAANDFLIRARRSAVT